MSDNWDFYFYTVDHKAASIFLDLGIRKSVPLSGIGGHAWLRVYMNAPREDGLSSEEEQLSWRGSMTSSW